MALGCEFQQAPNTGGFEGWRLQTRLSETSGSQTSVCISLLGGEGEREGALLKHRFLPLFPQTFSSKSRLSPRICISSQYADGDDTTGPETTL